MKNLFILSVLGIVLLGCNDIGGTGTSISAAVTSGSCTNFTSMGESCVITITYNTNGVANSILSYTPNPLSAAYSNGTFTSSLGTCQIQVSASSSGQFTCPITITYTTGYGSSNVGLAFTLNGVTSNTIQLSGSN